MNLAEQHLHPDARVVLTFWFQELSPRQWFAKDDSLDLLISERFGAMHAGLSRCEGWLWRSTAEGRLAEILVLDQFSRNMFRDSAHAFASDPLALALAQELVALGFDSSLPIEQRRFVYMPYMHSESRVIHEQAMKLFAQPGLEDNLRFEIAHKEIIDRFGRYPHRNAVLGRESTLEELTFLEQPGSSF